LADAWIARAADAAEPTGAYGRSRIVEIGAVENIEELAAQLKIQTIAERESAEHTDIPRHRPRTADRPFSEVSEAGN